MPLLHQALRPPGWIRTTGQPRIRRVHYRTVLPGSGPVAGGVQPGDCRPTLNASPAVPYGNGGHAPPRTLRVTTPRHGGAPRRDRRKGWGSNPPGPCEPDRVATGCLHREGVLSRVFREAGGRRSCGCSDAARGPHAWGWLTPDIRQEASAREIPGFPTRFPVSHLGFEPRLPYGTAFGAAASTIAPVRPCSAREIRTLTGPGLSRTPLPIGLERQVIARADNPPALVADQPHGFSSLHGLPPWLALLTRVPLLRPSGSCWTGRRHARSLGQLASRPTG